MSLYIIVSTNRTPVTHMLFLLITLATLNGPAWAQASSDTIADEVNAPAEATADSANPTASEPTTAVDITLNNGITLRGSILTSDALGWQPGQSLVFTPDSTGVATTLDAAKIKSVGTAATAAPVPATKPTRTFHNESKYLSPGGFSHSNVGKSRHLYAPSAIGMKQGQGYFSQKWLFSAAAYGVTDNLTLLAGTLSVFPPALTIAGGKISGEVAENIHLTAGGEVFMTGLGGFEVLANVGFGGITFGHDDKQITVSSGYGSIFDSRAVPVIVAGQVRLSNRAVFVTENWLVLPEKQTYYTEYESEPGVQDSRTFQPDPALIASAAIRLLGGRTDTRMTKPNKWTPSGDPKTTWDFGVIMLAPDLSDNFVIGPLPWIDFAYHFGKADR